VKVLAHRGLVGPGAAENTRAAFHRARDAGADGVETDVRRSGDGVLVLAHDRLLADGRAVSDLPAAVLGEAGVESLDDALALWPDAAWNLEVKAAEAFPLLRRLLASRPALDVLVSSFDHEALSAADLPRGVRRGALIAHRPAPLWPGALPPAAPARGGVDAIVVDYERLDEALVRRAREAGLACWAWGAATHGEHARAAGLGLEALITDHPDRALSARRARPAP
jgi:glycerophosphoryl diester phosphodiesterase